jgi:hypothetical protein
VIEGGTERAIDLLTCDGRFGYNVCAQEFQQAASMYKDAEELLRIVPFPFLVLELVRIRVGLRSTIRSCSIPKKRRNIRKEQKRVVINLLIRGCEQLFQVTSALTASVLAESCRQPEVLARTAITSER